MTTDLASAKQLHAHWMVVGEVPMLQLFYSDWPVGLQCQIQKSFKQHLLPSSSFLCFALPCLWIASVINSCLQKDYSSDCCLPQPLLGHSYSVTDLCLGADYSSDCYLPRLDNRACAFCCQLRPLLAQQPTSH